MAMMISKFHKLIQSKVVWYIILGVIVIAFVGFFTPTIGGSKSAGQKQQYVGEMFGEKVSRQELGQAFRANYIWYILSTGRQPDTRELGDALEKQAWRHLVLLRKAAEEKVIVSDQEIVNQIQLMPIFMNQQGVFDKNAYSAILGQIGTSPTQLENIVREQLAIQKMMYRPAQAALIAPEELERAYHMYSDRLVLDYALITEDALNVDVTVSREEAEAYFNANKEEFRMPAKVRVSYVEYPVADFMDQAEIPEGAALQFYNQNLDSFRVESTGDISTVEYKPFEEVEPEITTNLAQFSARRLAVEAATSLVADIAPRAQNEGPDFKGAVAAAGLTIKTLPTFGMSDELKGIDPTAPFKRAALGLQDDIYSSFSDAVVGKDSVYVISLDKRYESFIPGFETVEKQAVAAARARGMAEAAAARVQEIRDAVADALKNGSDFKTALQPYGVAVQTTEEFDLTSPPENDYANDLMRASIDVEQGGLCPVVPVQGGALFAYVAQRTATDPAVGLPALRDELVQSLSRVYSQRLVGDWQDQLMKEADLQIDTQ
jgi:hypothetical protein